MTQAKAIREIGDFKYYMGSHPNMRAHLQASKRPTEFGNKIWASSIVLINYLQENPLDLKDLRVLEIGCGWGLVGIYLAKVHSCFVTCTDFDERVLPIVQLQAELNDVTIKTKKASFGDLKESFLNNFDLIVGVEVCYSEEVGRDITELIRRAFEGRVNRVLIADPGRPDFFELQNSFAKDKKTELNDLPGSVNGKATRLLSIYNN